MGAIEAAVNEAMEATKDHPPEVRAAAVSAAVQAAAVPGPSGQDVNRLWLILIIGLLSLLLCTLGAIFYEVIAADKAPESLIAVFTTVFGALVGLFAKSPVQK